MKNNLKYLGSWIVILLLCGTSCKKFLGGDVNINPNKASTPTLNTLLPVVIESTSNNHFRVAFTTTLFAQQFGAYTSGGLDEDQNRNVRMGTAFLELYQNALTNLDVLVTKATEDTAYHYSGIGKILQAMNLALATDVWGDVPFTEAFKGTENLYPAYDKQEVLYPKIQQLLSDAILLLQRPSGSIEPRSDDLVYQGKLDRWIRTAQVLKARYAMHLTKKGATAAANTALLSLANGYPNSGEDCQLIYNERNLNPWNRFVSVLIKSGNFRVAPSQKFVDAMNGTLYPGLIDPRLRLMMTKGANISWIGLTNGAGSGNTVNLTDSTFYSRANSPLLMVTFAEQKFLEAEARFLSNGGTATSVGSTQAAYDAYLSGINAHMDKIGVSAPDKKTYVEHPLVAVTPAGLKLEHIMKEKFIAIYLHPEAWVDVRRYDYNTGIYKGMALPQNQDAGMNRQFIRRSFYPLDELNRNPSAVSAEKKLTDNVWWDQ